MSKMLVAVDFSDCTPRILDVARRTAKALGCQVYLVHVAAPDPSFVSYDAGPQHERDWRAEDLRHEHGELADQRAFFAEEGVEATPLLIQGPTVEKLLHEIERLAPELVVVGSHGHGALHRLSVGSVTDALVRHSQTPILVVPRQA